MSAVANKPAVTKSKPPKERKEKSQPSSTERLKTVVRRLPPNLPEEVFWQSVQPWVTEDTVFWKVFYPGKFRKRLNKENIPARAYIAFKNEEQLSLFSREYDGHLFRDKTGNESQAVVEFAPYQKVPTEKRKADARNATIEKDDDFISFLESLNAASANSEPVSLETLIAATQPPPRPKTTPLLEALKAQKEKELIARNHAHYKDGPSLAKKEDVKKKGVAAPAVKEVISKKAAKKAAAAAQKAAASGSQEPNTGMHKNANATAGPSAAASPSIKAPRRQQPPKSTPAPSAVLPKPNGPPNQTASVAPAPAPDRRPRAVVGLASRQFEAALTDAGVAASEKRKPEKEDIGKAKRRKDGNKPSVSTPAISVPSILQRPDGQNSGPPRILPRPEEPGSGAAFVPAVQTTPGEGASGGGGGGGGGGRGGRRYRGRGRGRGGG